MKYLRFIQLVFALWGSHYVYEHEDKNGNIVCDPPKSKDTRIPLRAAIAVAKIVWL